MSLSRGRGDSHSCFTAGRTMARARLTRPRSCASPANCLPAGRGPVVCTQTWWPSPRSIRSSVEGISIHGRTPSSPWEYRRRTAYARSCPRARPMADCSSSYALGGFALPPGLHWADELEWSGLVQTTTLTLSGAAVVEEWPSAAGRPITLEGGRRNGQT
jgi:hypothetical protein